MVRGDRRPVGEQALGVLGAVSAVEELDQFPGAVLDALAVVIPYDVASYNEVDALAPRIVEVSRPVGVVYPPELVERWVELRDEQPLYAHYVRTGDGSARRISDMLDRASYQRTRLYTEVYAALGVEFQLACALPSAPPLVVALALSRTDADFTDAERRLLEVLRPHLARCYEHARNRTLMRTALESLASGGTYRALVLCDGGRLEPVGSRAADILGRWFAEATPAREELMRWIERQRAGAVSAVDGEAPRGELVHEDAEHQLSVRFVSGGHGPDIVLFGERPRVASTALESLGLRRREAEVLLLAADGLDNRAIAASLDISVATVRKHLEGIYAALGVGNRTAAVAAVYQLRAGIPD